MPHLPYALFASGPLGCFHHLGTVPQWRWGSWHLFDKMISILLGKRATAVWLDSNWNAILRRFHSVFHMAPLADIPLDSVGLPFPPRPPHQHLLSSLSDKSHSNGVRCYLPVAAFYILQGPRTTKRFCNLGHRVFRSWRWVWSGSRESALQCFLIAVPRYLLSEK